MACGDSDVILVGGGVPGPAGPQGPPGPPGTGTSFPIAASNISVTNPGYANLQEVLDYLLYVPLSITSFSAATSVYLIGNSVSSLTFNWSINKTVLTKTITGPNTGTVNLTTSPTVVALSPSLNPGTVGANYTYTLTANDGVDTETANQTIYFYNNVYFGDAVDPGAITSAFINGLGFTTQGTRNKTVISNASGAQYAWFAHRVALGTATFTVGGFPGGFNSPVLVSHTNSAGFTEDYYVYRSTNPGIGPVTYVVS